MLSNINPDLILSDPLLLTGVIFFVLGPVFFFYAFFKYIKLSRQESNGFDIPDADIENPYDQGEPVQNISKEEESTLAQRIINIEQTVNNLKTKEFPVDANEFTQKLLKLAQHVMVLEKDMAKLKSHVFSEQKAEEKNKIKEESKPPIMPL